MRVTSGRRALKHCNVSPGLDGRPAEAAPSVKGTLKVTLNFTQTLMKKLPGIVDGNPVKMALSLAKAIIEIKDVRPLFSTRSKLLTFVGDRP